MKKTATQAGSGQQIRVGHTLPATEAERFLQLLGKDPAETWFRTIAPRKGANRHRSGADLHGFDLTALEQDNNNGQSIYLITGDANQATGKQKKTGKLTGCVEDADVRACRAVFVEWDDRPIDWQKQAWRELGLPKPTAMVATGGKSIHCYWVLSEPMAPDLWRVLQRRLIEYAGGDKACKNPSRLMRLPGFRYIDKSSGEVTDRFAELIHQADVTYSAAEIEARLPTPEPSTPPAQRLQPLTTELPPRDVDAIRAAVAVLPRRKKGGGTYEHDRNAICGCSAALAEAGEADPDGEAVRLMAHLWEHGEWQARQILESTTTRKAASFWAIAKNHGFDLRRHDLKPAAIKTASSKPKPSLQAIVQTLEDGWTNDGNRSALPAGYLANLLPAERFRFNELSHVAEVQTSSGWQEIRDSDLDSAYVLLTGMGWKIGIEPVTKALLHVARQQSFHPVREYLKQIEADTRIDPFDLDRIAAEFFRAPATMHAVMVRKWLIGAVARAMDPGCQMDACLVLQGDQGLGKSRALEALASPDWFCSTVPDQDKDFLLNVHSCWVFELAELESITGRREEGRLKNLITTPIDRIRPPYARSVERMPRQSVFAGTVNPKEFLRDDTGNRRFWVVPIEGTDKLDTSAIKTSRDRIWKAGMQAWRAGEDPMLPAAIAQASEQQNSEFSSQDAWLAMLEEWIGGQPLGKAGEQVSDPLQPFTSAEALISAGLRHTEQITKADEMRVAVLLRQLGYSKGSRGKTRVWLPPQPQPKPQPPATSSG